MLEAWTTRLREHHFLPQAPLLITGTESSCTALALASLWQVGGPSNQSRVLVVMTSDQLRTQQLKEDLEFLTDGVDILEWVERPFHSREKVLLQDDASRQRIRVLHALQHGFRGIVIGSAHAFRQKTLTPQRLAKHCLRLALGEDIALDALIQKLTAAGFERVPLTRECGEFSIRGGILDLFPANSDWPLRLELLGSFIESIRIFDPGSQRTKAQQQPLQQIDIAPISEWMLNDDEHEKVLQRIKDFADHHDIPKTARDRAAELIQRALPSHELEDLIALLEEDNANNLFFDYLHSETLIAQVHRFGAAKIHQDWDAQVTAHLEEVKQQRAPLFALNNWISDSTLNQRLQAWPTAYLEDLGLPAAGVPDKKAREIQLASQPIPHETRFMTDRLRGYLRQGYRVNIACYNEVQMGRLRDIFAEEKNCAGLQLKVGDLQHGFVVADQKWVCLADREIFGIQSKRRRLRPGWSDHHSRDKDDESLMLEQFEPGSYVVHLDHGIGIFRGLQQITVRGEEMHFALLEYQDGDKLYLPIYRLNLIQPYAAASSDDDPSGVLLDRLGGTAWEVRKNKARKDVQEMAQELLKLYASRKIVEGLAFGGRDPEFSEFEAAFPFTETRDQATAIDDVLTDMQTPRPMDRLICGDVGFGKTEVAMRGAYRAVLDRKQVAVLVPTTLLAQQHARSFKGRMENFGVKIESLSRFKTPKEQKQIIEDLKQGKIDIVIGTHRLLSADVQFKDLGLLIIDEEHRFGVQHKDKIKQYRAKIDVIAMTATPIPRTLQMSLYGFRDMSVIETPPIDRQAIQTFVARFDDHMIRTVILNETRRGGQLFFVHNRVHTIDAMERYLLRLVPEIKIGTVYGTMDETQLETVMQRFLEKQIDLLLATTIIESGLDFPNANTILINRADHFGLAQLYQLRGRVGRSDREAFAYLLIPGEELISDMAEKRLRALRSFTELGSGYRIAQRDLEIRGAGNLLGNKQSGHIRAVGLELYTTMLDQAVRQLQGETLQEEIEPELQFSVPAYLPRDFVSEETVRLALYRRLSRCTQEAEVEGLRQEFQDRFGTLPAPVLNLLAVLELRNVARTLRVRRLTIGQEALTIQFDPSTKVAAAKILALLTHGKTGTKMLDAQTLWLPSTQNDRPFDLLTTKNLLKQLA